MKILRFLFVLLFLVSATASADLNLTAPHAFFFSNANQWEQLGSKLLRVRNTKINIRWSGIGGVVMVEKDFVDAMLSSEKQNNTILLIIEGSAISAHADAVCYASDYKMQPGSALIFHDEFIRNPLTGHKIYSNNPTWLSQCVARGILTIREQCLIIYQHKRIVVDDQHHKTIMNDWL